jgi:formylglycine-generating enzyme required for sulfatase activity
MSAVLLLMGADAPQAPALAPGTPPSGKSFVEKIPNTLITFEMIEVPAGEIKLAGAKEPTKVKSFYIGKTELTWQPYDIWAYRMDLPEKERSADAEAQSRPSKPYGTPDRGYGHDGYPALGIPLHASKEYCKWLSAKTGRKYRLPTEAEWEYIARAGASPTPLAPDKLKEYAWFDANSEEKSQPVAKKKPNAWGLFDTMGNVSEWAIRADGSGITCGGSWRDKADEVSPAARTEYNEEWQSSDPQSPKSKWWLSDGDHVGLRLVCDKE